MATDFEREIRAAFADVVPRGADAALATSIRARLAETTVIRRRSGPLLSRPALTAGLVAAVVIVLIGVPLLGRVGQPTPSTDPGGVAASASAEPSTSPSPGASQPASAQPTAGAIPVTKDMFGDQSVNDLRLVSDTVGWVATSSGLYRTADGGRTWTDVPVPLRGTLPALTIVDATTVAIVSNDPTVTVAITHDAGASWVETPITGSPAGAFPVLSFQTPTIGSVTFIDDRGRLQIRQTSDGGQTWSGPVGATLPDGQGKFDPERGGVLALNVGKADNKPFNDHLWLSTDGGRTWPKRTFPIDGIAPAGHLKWLIGEPWVEAGGQILLPIAVDGSRNAIYESHDDGRSWRLVKAVPSPRFADFLTQFLSATDWVLVAEDGSEIWSTTDGGASWRHVRAASPIFEILTTWASPNHGWALHACNAYHSIPGPDKYCDGTGLKAVLLETTDGGRTWTPFGG